MTRLALVLLVLVPSPQDPAFPSPDSPDSFKIRFSDPETGERRVECTGIGKENHETGTADLRLVHATIFTKSDDPKEPSRTIQLHANRCTLEGIGHRDKSDQIVFKFFDGLRVQVDDNIRLWTNEGTFDLKSQVLKSPGRTHVVQYTWPAQVDLKSMLVFADPEAMGWLRMFGAPEPDFELEGEDFEFDASTFSFSADRKGRLRVRGNPGASFQNGSKKKKKKNPQDIDPTELRCEGPLQLKNLGAAETDGPRTVHLTASRDVVIERLARTGTVRTHSDSASIYMALPPKKAEGDPRLLSALLKGNVHLEESGGVQATAESFEWNHQDDLLKLTGLPKVEVFQGNQRLEARQVIVDKRAIDFFGDISATFLSASNPNASAMTLIPGDLRIRTDALGRPQVLQARNGVRLFTRTKAAGEDALEATGTEFEWDLVQGSGSLRGAPFARLEQGPNLVISPLVTFDGESFQESVMTIKGPKVMRFFTEFSPPRNLGRDLVVAAMGLPGVNRFPDLREPALHTSATVLEAALGLPGLQRIPGRGESYMDLVATCDGDAVLDQKAGVVKLVDRCSVRSQDSTLFADRLFVVLKKNGDRGVDRVVGLGNVRATQSPASGLALRVEGESLEMRLDSTLGSREQRIVRIVGHPLGRGWLGPAELSFRRLTLNLDDESGNLSVEIDQGNIPGF